MKKREGLYRLLYVSDYVPSAACDLGTIIEKSRAFNGKHRITGALWFDGEHFIQLLEGGKEELNAVFQRIINSPCHTDVDIICFQNSPERLYTDWVMSYLGSECHNRDVAEQFAGGPDLCLRSLPSSTLIEMLHFLEEERQGHLARSVG